jgi:hypothetical protein
MAEAAQTECWRDLSRSGTSSTLDFFDVHPHIDICKPHDEKVGIGADHTDALLR